MALMNVFAIRIFKFFALAIVLFCISSGHSQTSKVSYPEALKGLHQNLLDYYLGLPLDDDKAAELLNTETTEGSWEIVNYNDTRRGKWKTKEHLDYVQLLARAYQNKDSKFYHQKDVSKKIHLALNYWLKNDFLSRNWWDQHIGVPELLAPTLFLMEAELSKKQINESLVLLRRAKIKMSGQNKVWLSGNVLSRALLVRDADSVAIASKSIQEELAISKGVGIKADWSYHEHGAQLQFGNYGLSYLEDMIRWYQILNHTTYQFEKDKIEVLRNYILEGQQWVIYNGNFDISASGRQLFIDEPIKKYQRLKEAIESMELLDTAHKTEYEAAINSKILEGDKHFWKSDFHVHRTKDFYFSVKMSSIRVVGTESVNEENLKGYYLGDGTSLLYQDNDKYKNILPFWNWKKLPGVTTIQDTMPLPVIKAWDFKSNSHFVGGVSDGKNGMAVMDYDRDGLQAKKAWFMFGNYMLCMGSAINADTNFGVTTGIDQVYLKGALEISKNDVVGGEHEKNQSVEPDWILHNNTGYLFPQGSKVQIETRFLEGTWNSIATVYRPVILTENILRIWFDHGKHPIDKTYAYILVPNADREQMRKLNKEQPFTFINKKDQQSAITQDGNLGGVIFYKAGKSELFGGITVNQPVMVMIEKNNGGLRLSVSDPSQELKNIQITLQGTFTGDFASNKKNQTDLDIPFPTGEEAGKTVIISLKRN